MSEPHDEAPELVPLDPEEERALIEALAAAFRPRPLDAERHERIIEECLQDPFAPPSEEELVESDRLRRALEGEGTHPDLALAAALRAASGDSGSAAVDRALERAGLASEPLATKSNAGSAGGGNVVYAVFGAAGAALALAAALALLVVPSGQRPEPTSVAAPAASAAAAPELAVSRSTAPLFEDRARFDAGGPSARIDRISAARSRDLRGNRYAQWGVR